MRQTVFISYSRQDKDDLDRMTPALRAVPRVKQALWYDEHKIDYGDKFDDEIRAALAASRVGILLISPNFFDSEYIKTRELPFLIEQAERDALALGIIYLRATPAGALEIEATVDGERRVIDLPKVYHSFTTPKEPLDSLETHAQHQVFANLADWVKNKLPDAAPVPSGSGERYQLALRLRRGKNRWDHQFVLPDGRQPSPPPASPDPGALPPYGATGEELFEILFSHDSAYLGNLFALAFDLDAPVEPTRSALRLHLLLDADTDDLARQPWSQLSYRGRRLAELGWSVELRPASPAPEFPEPVPHTLRFPDRVVVLVGEDFTDASHLQDIEVFFRRYGQEHVPLSLVSGAEDFEHALREGTPRLVYYYGPVESGGLRLQSGNVLSWATLERWLEGAGTVSILYLNLIGDAALDAVPRARPLLDQTRAAVMLQCAGRVAAHDAAAAAMHWLRDVLLDETDPILALHRHQIGPVYAWSRYGRWALKPPATPDDPKFVNLSLDRDKQRKVLHGAKDDFYTGHKHCRIHHVVAYGEAGNHAGEFPDAVTEYLRENKKEREVFFAHTIRLDWAVAATGGTDSVESAVRRALNWQPGRSIDSALLPPEMVFGQDVFGFVILGWELPAPGSDREHCRALMEAVTHWCETRLSNTLAEIDDRINLRIVSIMTLELTDGDLVEAMTDEVEDLQNAYYENPAFFFGELDALSGVRKPDLRRFFQNEERCRCTDAQRKEFPDLLLGDRKEMSFDLAVETIRRGYPYMGGLYDELSELKDQGLWPPQQYNAHFWKERDAR